MPAAVEPRRHDSSIRPVSFADDLVLTTGAKSDWSYFSRWHYLGHTIGVTSRVFVLWRSETPIGIVTFGPPALGDEQRHEAFSRVLSPSVINKWFSMVSRVVLDPRYRGAGIAATTLRDACRRHADLDNVRYIEAKTSMGTINRFNQAAGFDLIGSTSQIGTEAESETSVPDRETTLAYTKHNSTVRRIYKFLMDTEDEFDLSVT